MSFYKVSKEFLNYFNNTYFMVDVVVLNLIRVRTLIDKNVGLSVIRLHVIIIVTLSFKVQ